MATTKEKWQEIADRGLQDNFDPATRAKFDEAVNRGLITVNFNITQQAPQPEQESTFGQKLIGGIEGAASLATGLIAEPIAGLAGIAAGLDPFRDEGAAAETVAAVKKALTFNPSTAEGKGAIAGLGEALQPAVAKLQQFKQFIGDDAFAATGSPTLAAIATATPEALIELLGAGTAKRAAVQGAKQAPIERVDQAPTVQAAREDAGITQTPESVAEALQKGTPEELAAIVDADPKFYQAADELGIDVEPLASFASQNPQFISVSNALEVVPGSVLEPQASKFIERTAQAADELIQKYGGTKDKAQLGLDFKSDALKTIDDLYDKADVVYGNLRKVVDEKATFAATRTVQFLEELNAADKLSPKLKSVLNQLKPKQVKTKGFTGVNPATGQKFDTGTTETVNPKLGRIDILRKQFGQAVGKGKGEFRTQEAGLNKALYARLTDDLDNISDTIGGDALQLSDAGKGLVKQRKQLEDNLTKLLGKDLSQALNVNVSGAVKGLAKGEVDKFTDTIKAIPEAKRGEIVLSAMNDVFKGSGVRQTAFGPTQFTKWYQTINRSPAAKKALFDTLPEGSQKAIDNLFEVSRGISRALGTKRPTGVVNALFNEKSGFIRRMLGSGAVKTAIAFQGGPAASAGANIVSDFISQTSSPAKAASNLMSDPSFKDMIRQATKQGVVDGTLASQKVLDAERKVMKTKRFKEWVRVLGNEAPAALVGGASGSLVGYLFNHNPDDDIKLDFTISGGVKP